MSAPHYGSAIINGWTNYTCNTCIHTYVLIIFNITFSFSLYEWVSVEVEVVRGGTGLSLCYSQRKKCFGLYTVRHYMDKGIYILDGIMQYYNSIWILMNFLKCLYCRYQTVHLHDDYAGERLTNAALWRPFTLLLSFSPSTSLHSSSNTIIFKHTLQPSSLIGRCTIGSHSVLLQQSCL